MPKLTLALYRVHIDPQGTASMPALGASVVLAHEGALRVGDTALDTGEGTYICGNAMLTNTSDAPAIALVFVLSDSPADDSSLAHEVIDVTFPFLLRLDEVAFPPGVQAYRHVHAGSGFRHLRWGELRLDADDHSFTATPGQTWFEPANTPVKATASATEPETRFVRCMVVPVAYQGKPTIQILDPADADRPKRQVTHRHVDQWLDGLPQVDAG